MILATLAVIGAAFALFEFNELLAIGWLLFCAFGLDEIDRADHAPDDD